MFEIMALTGGFWFFLFTVVVLVGGIFVSEMDNFFAGAVTFVLTLAGFQLFGYPIWGTIVANPFIVVVFLLLYFASGSAYAILYRYPRFLKSDESRIKTAYTRYWIKYKNENTSMEDFHDSDYFSEWSVSYNKDAIASWVLMWPWALFWDLLHRPFIWIYNNMYTGIGQALNAVGIRIVRRILNK